MANLWAGGEDTSFPNGAAVTVSTVSAGTNYRTGYARCYIGGGSLAAPCKSEIFPGGAITGCWFSFRKGSNNVGYIGFGKSGQNNFIAVQTLTGSIAVGTVIA